MAAMALKGLLEKRIALAIAEASEEVMKGRWDNQFILDVFQTGSNYVRCNM